MKLLGLPVVAVGVVMNMSAACGQGLPEYIQGGTVQDLYYACKETDNFSQMYCTAYLGGLADLMLQQGAAWTAGDAKLRNQMAMAARICDAHYSYGALQQVFINWAERNPNRWRDIQSMGAMRAFIEEWSCPRP